MFEHRAEFSLAAMLEALKVSRSGYYAWLHRPKRQSDLKQAISKEFHQAKARAGAPSIAAGLQRTGFICSARTVGRWMKKLRLRVRYAKKFKQTTDSKHHLPIAENVLNREFNVSEANRVWVGDITYVRCTEGWLYLAVMIDLFSRSVVGWQLSERMDRSLVIDALKGALLTRGHPKELLVHTDRGSQYCSQDFVEVLDQAEGQQSMSRKGNCWDNAVAESFFATLKKEEMYGQELKNREETRSQIFEYIEGYYNRVRRHSTLNWLSPVEFERLHYRSSEGRVV